MNSKFEPVMTSGRPAPLPGRTDSLPVDRNSVLRNTYWLLAISLLPVVAGAWLGMQLNFVSFFKAAPIMTPLVMFGAMFGMLFVVSALRNSAWGVAALLGFTFISGVFLTPILTVAGGLKNGGQLVALAGGMTAAIFFAMATLATVTKRDFSFMGKFLFIGLVLVIVASLANLFFQVPALPLAQIKDRDLEVCCQKIHDWRVRPSGTVGYSKAEVTRGGVSVCRAKDLMR